ncbi:hypothetical protein TRIUR3_14106 [Triticum urartu]|uniref:Uncharacterized protein n=1 Tax=Triticum urartu TaxID=4572 RepID=M7ZHX5_TRIUA|nr:hypothetical protein TRIUR3_14106 [Triticum urartu]
MDVLLLGALPMLLLARTGPALNGSDFLKEKEVPKGDGSNKSLNLRITLVGNFKYFLDVLPQALYCKNIYTKPVHDRSTKYR